MMVADDRRLARLWLMAKQFNQPSDWKSLTTYPEGFHSLSADQIVNMELWCIANAKGYPTDGKALLTYVKGQLGASAFAQGADVPFLLNNVTLKYLGAYT